MHKKYDTSIIDKEIKQNRRKMFFETATQFFWGLYPLGCALAYFAFIALMAFAALMWFTEPSLTGNY